MHHDPVYEPLTSEDLEDIRRQEEELRLAEIELEKKLAKETCILYCSFTSFKYFLLRLFHKRRPMRWLKC